MKLNAQINAKRLSFVVLSVEGWNAVGRPVAVVYRKGAYLSPAARRLIDLMKSTGRASEQLERMKK